MMLALGPRVHGRITTILRSIGAVDGYCERSAEVAHAVIAQRAEPLDKDGDRDALDGIQIDGTLLGDGIGSRLEQDLALQPTDCRRAGRDQGPAKPRDRGVPGQDHHRPPADLG